MFDLKKLLVFQKIFLFDELISLNSCCLIHNFHLERTKIFLTLAQLVTTHAQLKINFSLSDVNES